MLVNAESLDLVFKGFKATYTAAFLEAPVKWDRIAMQSKSSGFDERYGWMGEFPQLREWIGERHVKRLSVHDFTITNLDFESTVAIHRNYIADDKIGVFKPSFSEMGRSARNHPEEMVFDLLSSGFETLCYDGQNFFDPDHPTLDENGNIVSVSNMQDGDGPAWFLLDTSRAVRPIIWQEREPYQFQQLTSETDRNVFYNNEYIYGVRARVNAGFGLWQLAYGSKAVLSSESYSQARAAMQGFKSDEGRILGVKPMMLVVPPSLEEEALHIVNTEFRTGGGTNPWRGTAELIVSPYLGR